MLNSDETKIVKQDAKVEEYAAVFRKWLMSSVKKPNPWRKEEEVEIFVFLDGLKTWHFEKKKKKKKKGKDTQYNVLQCAKILNLPKMPRSSCVNPIGLTWIVRKRLQI